MKYSILYFLLIASLFINIFSQNVVNELSNITLYNLDLWLESNSQKAKYAGNYFLESADKFYSQKKLSESLDSFEKAQKAAIFIKDDILLAHSFWGQGLINSQQDNPSLSNAYLFKAKSIFEKYPQPDSTKWLVSISIEMYLNNIKLKLNDEAKKSLKAAYQNSLNQNKMTLNSSDLIGNYFHDLDPIQAYLWYKNALKYNITNPEVMLLRLSTILFYRGEYELAFEYLTEAKKALAKKPNSKDIWQIWQKYGEYYLFLGQYKESVKYVDRNCEWQLKNKDFNQALYCKCNLLTRYLNLDNLILAEENLKKAENILKEHYLNEESELLFFSHKGYLLAVQGYYKEAETVFAEIYPKKDKLVWGNIKYFHWYRAFVFYKQNRFEEALTEIDTILVKLRELNEVDQIKRFLVFRGKILFEMGRKEEAYQTFQESVDLIETGRRQIYNVRTSLGYFNKYKEAYDYLLQLSLEKNDAEKTVILADLLKSRVLADKVLSANTDSANKVQGYQSFYKTKEAEDLLQQIWVLSEKAFAENIDNDAEIATLEKTFQERLEAYNLLVNKKYEFAQAELNAQDIIKLDSIDANIVSFSFLPNGKLVRFLFRKSKPVQITELNINRTDLKNTIKSFRQQILTFKPFYATAQELYQTLLPPEKELDFTKPLIIIPDEELWSVPFSALILPNQKYLIEKTELALLPSLKSLILLDNGKSAAQTKVALFANSTGQGQSGLNSVKSEAEEIAKLYPKSIVFAESKATKEAFKQSVAESSILHVASHGLINLENPFESALILSKTDKDDGKLTVNEIIDIKIPSSLVVLSACDTSNGQILGGEGLLSLSWAFLVGGAKEVVGTQWKIEDTQSKKMMIEFHKGLKKGGNPIFSLQQAQRKALKNIAPFNHPYYWSGFVSIGSFR